MRYFGHIIWNLMHKEIKYSDLLLDSFTHKNRQCKPNTCFCRLTLNSSISDGDTGL